RHDRLRHYRARLIKMDVLPHAARLPRPDIAEIWAVALRTQQFRGLVGIIARCGRAAEGFISGEWAYLLGMTIEAAFRDIDVATSRLERGQRLKSRRRGHLRQPDSRQHAHKDRQSHIDQR